MEVLDTLLFIVNRRIESKVYFKPTEGHIYSLPKSSHHQSLYRNIPFGVALRLRRTCSRDDWLEEQLQEFKHFFNVDDIITTSLIKVLSELKTLHALMHFYPNLAQLIVCRIWCWLWTTYHPNFRDIPKLIRDYLSILYESPRMKKVFSDDKTRIRTGFRRTKTLKDLITPSVLPDLNRTDNLNSDVVGCFRCDRKVCDACQNFMLASNRIRSVATGKSYKIRHSLSCHTDYVIYCAICLLCNRQCVGSSVNFRARLSNHESHIKQRKRTCRLVNHFINNAHDHPLSSLKFVFIEQVSTKTEEFLEQREGYWQAQLWTYV